MRHALKFSNPPKKKGEELPFPPELCFYFSGKDASTGDFDFPITFSIYFSSLREKV